MSLNPELIFTATMKPFYRSGWIRYWDKRLMVVADGFQPISVQLEDHAGQGHRLLDPPLPPMTIEMKRRQPVAK